MNMVATHAERLLTLSDYRVMGPARIHPQAAASEEIVYQLCQQLGIYSAHYQGTTTLTQYLFPDTTLERLVACQLLTNTFSYLNDRYDRDTLHETKQEQLQRQAVYRRCVDLLRSGALPADPHPLYPVFHELHQRFRPLAQPCWLNRLADAILEYLHATIDPGDAPTNDQSRAVSHYIQSRALDSGARPSLCMVEFAHDIYLPETVMRHPYLQTMQQRCIQIGWMSNDLLSYHKEVIKLGSHYNLLAVLMESQGLTFAQAVHESVRIVNGLIDELVQGIEAIPVWSDSTMQARVKTYVCGLRDVVNAGWHWQLSTNRYRSPDSPFPELRTLLA